MATNKARAVASSSKSAAVASNTNTTTTTPSPASVSVSFWAEKNNTAADKESASEESKAHAWQGRLSLARVPSAKTGFLHATRSLHLTTATMTSLTATTTHDTQVTLLKALLAADVVALWSTLIHSPSQSLSTHLKHLLKLQLHYESNSSTTTTTISAFSQLLFRLLARLAFTPDEENGAAILAVFGTLVRQDSPQTEPENAVTRWRSTLLHSLHLFHLPMIIDLCRVYGIHGSNYILVRKMITMTREDSGNHNNQSSSSPRFSLTSTFADFSKIFVRITHSPLLVPHWSRLVKGGIKGKGKGKVSSSSTTTASFPLEDHAASIDSLLLIIDTLISMDALIIVGGFDVCSTIFTTRHDTSTGSSIPSTFSSATHVINLIKNLVLNDILNSSSNTSSTTSSSLMSLMKLAAWPCLIQLFDMGNYIRMFIETKVHEIAAAAQSDNGDKSNSEESRHSSSLDLLPVSYSSTTVSSPNSSMGSIHDQDHQQQLHHQRQYTPPPPPAPPYPPAVDELLASVFQTYTPKSKLSYAAYDRSQLSVSSTSSTSYPPKFKVEDDDNERMMPEYLHQLVILSIRVKMAVLAVLYTLLNTLFFEPMGIKQYLEKHTQNSSSSSSNSPSTSSFSHLTNAQAAAVLQLTNPLCDLIHYLIELIPHDIMNPPQTPTSISSSSSSSSSTHKHPLSSTKFLMNAPLLLDYDIRFNLLDTLRCVKSAFNHVYNSSKVQVSSSSTSAEGEEDVRLEYLIGQVEYLVTFSGNSGVKRSMRSSGGGGKHTGGGRYGGGGAASSTGSGLKPAISSSEHHHHQSDSSLKKKGVSFATSSSEIRSSGSPAQLPPPPHPISDDVYLVRTSLISQVQDLFPELGDGFIEACLVAFNDSAETVIDRILGCNLPQHVDSLDRKLRRQEPQQQQQKPPPLPHEYAQTALVPYTGGEPITETTAPPPSSSTSLMLTRRNVFDGDEFDVFSGKVVQQDALIFGKKENKDILHDPTELANLKSKILDVQFEYVDEYDDEYDDTYDSNDVKFAGTIELSTVEDIPVGSGEEEQEEYESRDSMPSSSRPPVRIDPCAVFEPDFIQIYSNENTRSVFLSRARKSKEREALKDRTGLTDEQIEGWCKMFERGGPARQTKLLDKYAWNGVQKELASNYQGSSQGRGGSRGGHSRGRGGRGRGGGGRAGGEGGSSSGTVTHSSSADFRHKEQNKARFANHNRKRGHDKKMAKANPSGF